MKSFILLLTLFIGHNLYSQIDECTGYEELYRGRHKVNGMTYGHPYTTFDRHNGITFEETLNRIRKRLNNLLQEDPLRVAYQAAYNNAISQLPNTNNDNGLYRTDANGVKDHTQLPIWGKNNAFVFLIGLDGQGRKLDSLDPTGATRNAFRDRALEAFEHLSGGIEHMNIFTMDFHMGDMQFYASALTAWAECYDLLKAAYEVPELRNSGRNPYGFGDADRNGPKCSPRNKLRKLARDFYWQNNGPRGVIKHASGWKKNHGIKAAGALLTVAQVLNDAGVETNYIRGFLGGLIGMGFHTPRPNYSPVNWNKVGQEGIDECLFKGEHWLLTRDVPQAPRNTNADEFSPYAEGPNYCNYGLLSDGLSGMRAQANLYPTWATEVLLNKNEIRNIFNWYDRIQTQEGVVPSYDNSKTYTDRILAITGLEKYYYGSASGISTVNAASFVAIVGGNNLGNNASKLSQVEDIETGGNLILRNEANNKTHQFMMLHERGKAIDISPNWLWREEDDGHEESDYGTFMLHSQGRPLALDPAYINWSNVTKTNSSAYHNILYLETYDDGVAYLPVSEEITTLNRGFELNYQVRLSADFTSGAVHDFIFNLWNLNFGNSTPVGRIRREVKSYTLANGELYYLLNDRVTSSQSEIQKLHFQLNGPGVQSAGTYSYNHNNHLSIWAKDSCPTSGLVHHYASLKGSSTAPSYQIYTGENYNQVPSNTHSRIEIEQNEKNTILQSVLLPYQCTDANSIPQFSRYEGSDFVLTAIKSIGYIDTLTAKLGKKIDGKILDTFNQCHIAQINAGSQLVIGDPYLNGNGPEIKTNAQTVFVSNGTFYNNTTGPCSNGVIRFKEASLTDGQYLAINDTDYIVSSLNYVNADIKHVSKFKYEAYVDPRISASCTVKFFLPDAEIGYQMTARVNDTILPGTVYEEDSFKISVTVTEPTHFVIELTDKCIGSCFFPPTTLPIDTIVEFNTGTSETLGHDLQILPTTGVLNITNYSEMNLCPGTIFYNNDSLILFSPNTDKRKLIRNCGNNNGDNHVREPRSRIIVGNGSTLMLMSGSITHIKQGGSIHVSKGGSLIIKDGAEVIIGGDGYNGFGELFLEKGAYLCVEPNAKIGFYSSINDTNDKNLFWVYNNPSGVNTAKTIIGVERGTDRYNRLIDSGFVTMNNLCTEICDFIITYPLNGITNREFGYFSGAKPLATFQLRSDYICIEDSLIIDTKRVLNEADWEYEVCKLNKEDSTIITGSCLKIGDINMGDGCPEFNYMSNRINVSQEYSFEADNLYKIKMKVRNGCGVEHDTTKLFYIASKPILYFDFANEVCEGTAPIIDTFFLKIGNTTAKHQWNVWELDTTSEYYDDFVPNSMKWEFDSIVNKNFSFPGFLFKGGNKYVISLAIDDICGTSVYTDTISIPFGVTIKANRLVSFSNPIGENGIQLIGSTTFAYDSIKWSPINKLINYSGLTPTTTTMDSTIYVLQAFKDNCTASDSILIKHRQLVNLGNDTTICREGNIMLGNSLDGLVMLGLLIYLDENTYSDIYTNIDASYPNAAQQLALFLYQDNYSFYNEMNTSSSGAFISLMKFMSNKMRATSDYPSALTLYKSQPLADVISFFRNSYWQTNSDLSSEIDSFVNTFGGLSSYLGIIHGGLGPYFESFNNNNGSINVTSEWYKNDTLLNSENNWLNIYEQNLYAPSKYSLVINNGNIVEYDDIVVTLDSIISPFFIAAYSIDSTVYFNGYPSSPAHLKYYWNFGDGDTSTSKNAIHTFNEFNKAYNVCLTISNMCNSYTSCDTLLVDTALNQRFILGKKETSTLPILGKPVENSTNNKRSISEVVFLGNNTPNPFGTSTEIEYEISEQVLGKTQFSITNTLGQDVLTLPIDKTIGKIIINKDQLGSGIYYYNLRINGVNSGGKIMIVE